VLSERPFRLAVLASHPIQYQGALYRLLASNPEIDLTVFFCSDSGLRPYKDEGFGRVVKWDIPLLEGYRSQFLGNVSLAPTTSRFWGLINPAILRHIRKKNFDAVWIHGWGYLTNWLALLTGFVLGVPVLLRSETNLLPTLRPWKKFLKQNLLKQLFKRVSAFLAIGSFNAEFYQAYGVPKEKIFLVPYSVDNDFFISKAAELLPKKENLKKTHGIPPELPVILFSGKLSAKKRPMDLLEAFSDVSRRAKAALVFVGDGALASDLKAYVEQNHCENVYFVGFQNQTELPTYYAMADLFVLPSDFEPWGLVVNEAMCFALPVITSDQVGSSGDLVQAGTNGFVFPYGNISALAEKMELLIGNPTLRDQMGRASREIIGKWSYTTGIESLMKCIKILRGRNNTKQV